jgi:hypothetical protein
VIMTVFPLPYNLGASLIMKYACEDVPPDLDLITLLNLHQVFL